MNKRRILYFLSPPLLLTFGALGFAQVTQCVIRDTNPNGNCGPYSTYDVTGSTGGNVNVQMGYWNSANAPAGSTQKMFAISPENWYVKANFPAGNTAVESYPNSDAIYFSTTNPLLTSYSYLFSGFGGEMNKNPDTSAESAYDIWLNNYANEVMIWTFRSNRSLADCTPLATAVTFGGSYGVAEHKWDLCQYASGEIVWSLNKASIGEGADAVYGIQTGSVDIYAMLMWLESNGNLPPSTYLTQIEYGFEVCSTGGKDEEFQINGFTVSASHP